MTEEKENKKEEKKEKRFVKKKTFSIEDKIKNVRESKLSDSAKGEYIGSLLNESKKDDCISFEVYSLKRGLKGAEKIGKEAMAKSKEKFMLSLNEWDNLFKKF